MIGMQVIFVILMVGIQNNEGTPISYALAGTLLMLYIYMAVYICIPRCRDTGLSPWTLLIFFIPYANIAYGLFLALMKPKEVRAKEMSWANEPAEPQSANQSS